VTHEGPPGESQQYVFWGTAVITPRWLYVLAAATPASYGDPHLVDETLESLDPLS
jgi:hypothetical protein